jgi:hypothetical protein
MLFRPTRSVYDQVKADYKRDMWQKHKRKYVKY